MSGVIWNSNFRMLTPGIKFNPSITKLMGERTSLRNPFKTLITPFTIPLIPFLIPSQRPEKKLATGVMILSWIKDTTVLKILEMKSIAAFTPDLMPSHKPEKKFPIGVTILSLIHETTEVKMPTMKSIPA